MYSFQGSIRKSFSLSFSYIRYSPAQAVYKPTLGFVKIHDDMPVSVLFPNYSQVTKKQRVSATYILEYCNHDLSPLYLYMNPIHVHSLLSSASTMYITPNLPFFPLGKPYIPLEPRATKFVFDRQNLTLPPHLQPIIPKRVHDELRNVRETATLTFNYLKKLDRLYHQRFYYMCPRTDRAQLYLHCASIDRLLAWDEDHIPSYVKVAADARGTRVLPTLAPSAKIPAFVLHFHVEEEAYTRFEEEYNRLRMAYLRSPYMRWINAKAKMEKVLRGCEREMGDMNYRAWRRWWDRIFLREMDKWEHRVQEIKIPMWTEIVPELYGLIRERVDLDGFWEQ